MICLRGKETLRDEEIHITSCPCSEAQPFSIAFQIETLFPHVMSGFFAIWPDLTNSTGSLQALHSLLSALQPVGFHSSTLPGFHAFPQASLSTQDVVSSPPLQQNPHRPSLPTLSTFLDSSHL